MIQAFLTLAASQNRQYLCTMPKRSLGVHYRNNEWNDLSILSEQLGMNSDKKEEFYYVCATLPSSKFVPKLALHLPPASLTSITPPRINITKIPNMPKQLFGSSNGDYKTRHYFQLRVNGSLSIKEERQLWLVNGVKNSSEKFTIRLGGLVPNAHNPENFFQSKKMIGGQKNGFLDIQVIPSCNQLNSEVIDNILQQQQRLKLRDTKGESIPTEDSIACTFDYNLQTKEGWTNPFQSRICSTSTSSTVQTVKEISQQMRERCMHKRRSILRPCLFVKDTQTIDQPETLHKIEKIASNVSYLLILITEFMLLITLMSPSLKI